MMMTDKMTPERWAFKITGILNTFFTETERFPVDVKSVAKEISKQLFPDDPVTMIKGRDLPSFDGGLFKAPEHKKGWGIIFNSSISSLGRVNFTLAHEFGHYLLHRNDYPGGIKCSSSDIYRWDSEYGQIEHQANVFAANLLMPLDDYRQQIDPRIKVDFDMVGLCADRYGVSLISAILRWIEFTERKAAIVLSRDGFILWSRASKSAYNSGIYFKTANLPPQPVPRTSLASDSTAVATQKQSIKLSAGVWFELPCEEMVIFSDNYDFVISLLLIE